MAFAQYIKGKPSKWKLDTRSPLQDMIFSIEASFNGESQKKTVCQKCGRHAYEVFQVFCGKTSLHGIQYVGEKSHIALRFFWSLIILLALCFSMYHIYNLYSKWQDTPVMVTLAPRVRRIEEIYFPAITICAPRILTKPSSDEFLKIKNETSKIQSFCIENNRQLNWDSSALSEDSSLDNYTRMSCEMLLQGARFHQGYKHVTKPYPSHVVHSKAILETSAIDCCTFNGLSQDAMYRNLNLTEDRHKKETQLLRPSGIGIQNEFNYKMVYPIKCPEKFEFKISIHHPAEAPNVEGDGLVVKTGAKVSYTIKPQDTEASDSLKSLKPKDRGCKFSEDTQLRFFKNYTQHNCKLDCLANYTISECGCLPPFLPESDDTIRQCNGSQIEKCFKPKLDEFRDTKYDSCDCDQSCAETTYLVTTQYVPTEQTSNIEISVFFTEPIFFSYYRSELYGLSDFLSSCGGLLGLFMGFSFISMVEVFYFSLFGIWRLLLAICRKNV